MSFTRFLLVLALVVWVGGIIFFAFVMAPTLFAVLPTHQLAGAVVGRALTLLHWIGIAAGVVFLSAAVAVGHWPGRRYAALLVVIMIALTLVSQFGISRKMMRMQTEIRVIDELPQTDPRRVEFNRLHSWSTRLEGTVLVLGLAVVYLSAREKTQDRYSRWN